MSPVESQDRPAAVGLHAASEEGSAADGPLGRFGPGARIAIIAGLAVAFGLAVWVVTAPSRDGSEATAGSLDGPRLVADDELTDVPDEVGHAVFWAGEQPGAEVEFSDDAGGNVHLRYLTDGADAGTAAQSYLDIGTYPFNGAYEATRSLAGGKGLETVDLGGGGIGFMDRARPYSVIMAWPNQPDLQIEVYHPEKRRALEIVRDGDIVPLP